MFKSNTPSSKRYLIPIALASIIAVPASAHARDCKNVTLEFVNQTGAEIRVRSVDAVGNKGSWTENISNIRLDSGASGSTNGRRMNRLDEGRTGSFFVNYDRMMDNGWASRQSSEFRFECTDDVTLRFELSRSVAQETGSCRRVRFAFVNQSDQRVQVRRVNVTAQGSDNTTRENVANYEIEPSSGAPNFQFTNRRRIQGVQDGQTATFEAVYRKFNSSTQEYEGLIGVSRTTNCRSGGDIQITLE